MSNAAPSPAPPYVRQMRPDEQHAVSVLCARAFATNRFQLFLGSVKRGGPGVPVAPLTTTTPKTLPRAARLLYYYQDGLVRTMLITGGRVMVVAQPREDGEKLVAVALWNRPGSDIANPMVILRSKQHRAVIGDEWHPFGGWKIAGLRRALHAQGLFVKNHEKATKAHGYIPKQCWTLEILATDPDEEGKGHAGRLMREGLASVGNLPCLLEVPSLRTKQIYEHFGFQETGVLALGVGQVDEAGFTCVKTEVDQAKGIQVWTMLRMPKA